MVVLNLDSDQTLALDSLATLENICLLWMTYNLYKKSWVLILFWQVVLIKVIGVINLSEMFVIITKLYFVLNLLIKVIGFVRSR
jgi:hypothetical protein